MLVGKGVFGKSSLITTAISGRMTVARGVRSGSAKPKAKVERMETAAMRANLMVGKRQMRFFCSESGRCIKVGRRLRDSRSSSS